MKIPICGALRCANSTLRQVYCFLEISLSLGTHSSKQKEPVPTTTIAISIKSKARPMKLWYHDRQFPDEIQELANRCSELLKRLLRNG